MDRNKITKKSWIIIGVIFIVLTVVLGFIAYYFAMEFYPAIFGKPNRLTSMLSPIQKDNIGNNSCVDCVRRNIDGVYVKKGEENPYPIAVIIENHPDARPASGLARASLVFEAEAEGGITRFLAIFANEQNLEEIGPIRSARPYFVDWAKEFSAALVHCGGSPASLVKIAQDNVFSLNEFYNGGYYWRSEKRSGPHNIYTSTENLNKYLESKGLDNGKFLSWQYKNDQPVEEGVDGANITINFKPPSYVVDWIYDMENNDYIRYLAGERHKDVDEEEIRVKNVAIAIINVEVIDDEWRLKMSHIGEGKAIVCLDGQCAEGKWNKKTSSARTRFYDKSGEEFMFNAGTTWIEVVRSEIEVEFE